MIEEISRLIDIVATLREPGGCPWDREQTHKSLLFCLLDEVYEFFQAVDENNFSMMKEELGDILLQVVIHSQIAKEKGIFNLEDVAREICEKLIRRHPHVYGTKKVSSSKEVIANWEAIKKSEKGKENRHYFVDGIAEHLPALLRAEKVQRRVARVGFDWQDIQPTLKKVEEEFQEFREAIDEKELNHATEELGDILFALVNVARHCNICAEEALQKTVKKFTKRFRYIEDKCKKNNLPLNEASLEELDAYWEESKKEVG